MQLELKNETIKCLKDAYQHFTFKQFHIISYEYTTLYFPQYDAK